MLVRAADRATRSATPHWKKKPCARDRVKQTASPLRSIDARRLCANLSSMPILTNSRHELFAQAVASGKSASKAYRQSGATGKNADVHMSVLPEDREWRQWREPTTGDRCYEETPAVRIATSIVTADLFSSLSIHQPCRHRSAGPTGHDARCM